MAFRPLRVLLVLVLLFSTLVRSFVKVVPVAVFMLVAPVQRCKSLTADRIVFVACFAVRHVALVVA